MNAVDWNYKEIQNIRDFDKRSKVSTTAIRNNTKTVIAIINNFYYYTKV